MGGYVLETGKRGSNIEEKKRSYGGASFGLKVFVNLREIHHC